MLSQMMMLKMFGFNHQTNNRLLDLATMLTPEQWDAPQDIGRRSSLRETMFHTLIVEEEWVYFCEHSVTRFDFRKIEDYPDVASLRRFSDDTYQWIQGYLENLDEEKLTATITGAAPGDVERNFSVWYILLHAVFHSAQHRSEAAEMLTRFGYSPGFIDFINHDL